jgi:hypothetical protein
LGAFGLVLAVAVVGCGKTTEQRNTELQVQLKELGWEDVACYDGSGHLLAEGRKDGLAFALWDFGGRPFRVDVSKNADGSYAFGSFRTQDDGELSWGQVKDRTTPPGWDEGGAEATAQELLDAYKSTR